MCIRFHIRFRGPDREDPEGGFTQECCNHHGEIQNEYFRADAKADGDHVGIGGWECKNETPPDRARWFYVKVIRIKFPWMFACGEPFRLIASLELLGTLFCWLAFRGGEKGVAAACACGKGWRCCSFRS